VDTKIPGRRGSRSGLKTDHVEGAPRRKADSLGRHGGRERETRTIVSPLTKKKGGRLEKRADRQLGREQGCLADLDQGETQSLARHSRAAEEEKARPQERPWEEAKTMAEHSPKWYNGKFKFR